MAQNQEEKGRMPRSFKEARAGDRNELGGGREMEEKNTFKNFHGLYILFLVLEKKKCKN